MIKFANILFAGNCNARCPFCIGKQIDPQRQQTNLEIFPIPGLNYFLDIARAEAIPHIVLTGSNTDPLLYNQLAPLIKHLRTEMPNTTISLHTNGRLVRKKIATVNLFDKICVSLPSFQPQTYQKMMGVPIITKPAKLFDLIKIPIKLSCLVNNTNASEIPDYLERCRTFDIQRVVLRKTFGEECGWEQLIKLDLGTPEGRYGGCPSYNFNGIQVTLWDFHQANIESLNLFANGETSRQYHLA